MEAAEIEIPGWVPSSVAQIGVLVPCLADVRLRLLTDPRMEAVWREIGRNSPNAEYLASIHDWRRLSSWDLEESNRTPAEIASAALFAYAAVNFSQQPHVWTTARKEDSLEQIRNAAWVCESFAYDSMMASNEEQRALRKAAGFLVRMSETITALKGPRVLDKDAKLRSDMNTRVQARELAVEFKRLFGSFLYGTVAVIVTVGLGTPKTITLKSVSNWCADFRNEVSQPLAV